MGARLSAGSDVRRPRGFLAAIAFLTRIPVSAAIGEPDVAASIAWFPVVGAVVGGLSGAVFVGASRVWSPLVAASLAVAASVAITGAFHEDGLGDTADAAGAASTGRDPQPVLKDPRMGAFGVVALILAFALRIGALAALSPHAGWLALIAAHALARGVSAGVVVAAPSAGAGLGSSYAALASRWRGAVAVVLGVLIAVGCLRVAGVVAVIVCVLLAASVATWARRRLGGVSGDVLGAIEQLGEIATLLAAAA